jgi:SAM-dependent methyltransferase
MHNSNLPESVEFEDVNCPNKCSREDILVLSGYDLLNKIPGLYNVYRCQGCGLERTNPRPTINTIDTYYPPSYAPYQSEVIGKESKLQNFKKYLRFLIGHKSRELPNVKPGRMLEIGCSSGNYMEQARQSGWTVDGIEFSPDAAAIARSKGFLVHVGAIENIQLNVKKYDLITAWMVLEHLHQPVEALRKASEWVKPHGYLVALVPSADSLSRRLFGSRSYDLHLPNHLFHYTPKTLNTILSNSGWKLEKVKWQNNCMPLLHSFEYWASERNISSIIKFSRWLCNSVWAAPIRLILDFFLGVTRQSGRIEIWARPNYSKYEHAD